ncbi:malate dehydrogenase [Streptomyces sp. NPDC059169]|uniref:malate dehydrogenase n=1 Tax=Streptomyces sp. NPDC059169 TaxID=3346754 RepID=UPI00367AA4A8
MAPKNNATIGIIGAGRVGSAIANAMARRGYGGNAILFDRGLARAEGQAWDTDDAIPFTSSQMSIRPTSNLGDMSEADVIAITVGYTDPQAKTRLTLAQKTAPIVREVVERLDDASLDAVLLVVSNPVDVMTRVAVETSRRPESLVLGTGTVNDTARLRRFLSAKLRINHRNINSYVVGEHGDHAFFLWSCANVAGIPLAKLLSCSPDESQNEIRNEINAYVRRRGNDVVRRKGFSDYGIATAVAKVIEGILADERMIATVSHRVHAMYRSDGAVMSMPCILGAAGVEKFLEYELDEREQLEFAAAREALNGAYSSVSV